MGNSRPVHLTVLLEYVSCGATVNSQRPTTTHLPSIPNRQFTRPTEVQISSHITFATFLAPKHHLSCSTNRGGRGRVERRDRHWGKLPHPHPHPHPLPIHRSTNHQHHVAPAFFELASPAFAFCFCFRASDLQIFNRQTCDDKKKASNRLPAKQDLTSQRPPVEGYASDTPHPPTPHHTTPHLQYISAEASTRSTTKEGGLKIGNL